MNIAMAWRGTKGRRMARTMTDRGGAGPGGAGRVVLEAGRGEAREEGAEGATRVVEHQEAGLQGHEGGGVR
jgi:hypothetical protein